MHLTDILCVPEGAIALSLLSQPVQAKRTHSGAPTSRTATTWEPVSSSAGSEADAAASLGGGADAAASAGGGAEVTPAGGAIVAELEGCTGSGGAEATPLRASRS